MFNMHKPGQLILRSLPRSRPTVIQLVSRSVSNDTKPCQEISTERNPEKALEEKAQESAKTQTSTKTVAPTKTQAQLDEELRLKMSGLSDDGGEAGIEYEDGQPVAIKRSVKNNMFRYI